MSKYVFDIETNGLFPDKVWMLVMQDCTTEEVYSYSDYDSDLPSIKEGLARLSEAKIIAGHNIISFDLPVMKKLLNWEPSKGTRIWDTFIMSQL